MPPAAWPATLPSDVLQGYVEGGGKSLLRTTMDAGPAKQRRRFTAVARPFQVTIELTRAQVAAFDSFVTTTLQGASLPFDWTHPRKGTAVTFRFTEEPDMRHHVGELWRVPLKLEILP